MRGGRALVPILLKIPTFSAPRSFLNELTHQLKETKTSVLSCSPLLHHLQRQRQKQRQRQRDQSICSLDLASIASTQRQTQTHTHKQKPPQKTQVALKSLVYPNTQCNLQPWLGWLSLAQFRGSLVFNTLERDLGAVQFSAALLIVFGCAKTFNTSPIFFFGIPFR